MPQTIESFVKTLETEGVNAGKKAAEKIQADARTQADKIIADGRAEAERIILDAKTEAEKIKARMDSSLALAGRDMIAMLRDKLSRQLTGLLKLKVDGTLSNEDNLAGILREVISVYAKADAQKKLTAEINVPENIKKSILDGAIKELTAALGDSSNVQINVKQNLAKAGFEYKIEGSTVEVSTDSVTALLSEMIDPQLQQFLAKAAENAD